MMRIGPTLLLLLYILSGGTWFAPTPPRQVAFPPPRREVLV